MGDGALAIGPKLPRPSSIGLALVRNPVCPPAARRHPVPGTTGYFLAQTDSTQSKGIAVYVMVAFHGVAKTPSSSTVNWSCRYLPRFGASQHCAPLRPVRTPLSPPRDPAFDDESYIMALCQPA